MKKNQHLPSLSTIQLFNNKGKELVELAHKVEKQSVVAATTVEIKISIPRKLLPLVSALYSIRAGVCPDVDNIILKKTSCNSNQLEQANHILDQIELTLAQTT